MTMTLVLPDGAEVKPVEFYRWLDHYCAGQNIRVHKDGADTKHLVWDGKTHRLQDPAPETLGSLFMTDEALTYCQALVYNQAGQFIGR